jgi:parallel beta-helix repeat protein
MIERASANAEVIHTMAHLAMRMMCKLGQRVFWAFVLGSLLIGLLSVNLVRSDWTIQTSEIIVPDQYSTIQEAIDNAVDGDTISVRAGTYYEHVVVSKTVSIVGEDASATIIDGNGTGNVFAVNKNSVNITGFTVQNSGRTLGNAGLRFDNVGLCSISGNSICDNFAGIWFEESSRNLIAANDIIANIDDGIVFNYSHNNTVSANNIAFHEYFGIVVNWSHNNTICYNNVTQTLGPSHGDGINLWNSSHNNIFENHVEENNRYGIRVEGQSNNNTISGNRIGNCLAGLQLYDSSNFNLIYNNDIAQCSNGIDVYNSRYAEIFNNTIAHNYGSDWNAGVRLESAGYTVIHDNEILDNWRGILLYASSPYVSVYGNNVTSNEYGIRVAMGGSSYVNVSGNLVANNRGYGIDVTGFGGGDESNYATIARNLIVNNTFEAVGLGEGSNYNTVVQNNMIENGHAGVTLERYSNYNTIVQNNMIGNAYGICFDLFTVNSTQNTILNNNIIDNTQQVRIVPGSVNEWNGSYASGGNYWSDYSGLDQFGGPYQNVAGSDGVGDAPYVIDANNRDGYPLMDPWRPDASDWTVDDDGFADFHTIQEAIDNAVDGDTIFVKAGIYYEHVVVNKTVTLVGEDVVTTVIDGNETGRVINIIGNNVSVTGFTVQKSGSISVPDLDAGICLDGITDCTVSETHLVGNGFAGISLLDSERNIITNNHMTGTGWVGIHLLNSSNNTISKNILDSNIFAGINGHASSHHNSISENVIMNSTYGMFYHDANYNTIFRNKISDIAVEGIWLQEQVNHNTVAENNLINCSIGIRLLGPNYNNTITRNNISMNRYGFYVESSQNFIYHNNVLNNTQQAYVVSGSVNFWDNGYQSGGNHWSDYNGLDVDGDGIGDTQYDIDVYNVDRYPLISFWTRRPGDINDDRIVDTFDAWMLATAFGSNLGSKNWISEADLNRDNTIDIFDAITLALNFGKQWM